MPKISKREARRIGLSSGTIHSIIAPKMYDLMEIKDWLKKHGFKSRHRTMRNTYRFNQTPEVIGAIFYSKRLPNDLVLTFQRF
jgi:hypothetical protein